MRGGGFVFGLRQQASEATDLRSLSRAAARSLRSRRRLCAVPVQVASVREVLQVHRDVRTGLRLQHRRRLRKARDLWHLQRRLRLPASEEMRFQVVTMLLNA